MSEGVRCDIRLERRESLEPYVDRLATVLAVSSDLAPDVHEDNALRRIANPNERMVAWALYNLVTALGSDGPRLLRSVLDAHHFEHGSSVPAGLSDPRD